MKKLRHLNKKLLATITLTGALAGITPVYSKNIKKQKTNNEDKNDVTVEDIYFEEIKKEPIVSTNIGGKVAIFDNGTSEFGTYTKVDSAFPLKNNWALTTGIELANTKDDSYSALGVDNTTNLAAVNIGIQKEFKNGNFFDVTAIGGVEYRTENSMIVYNGNIAYRHEKMWHTPFGGEITIGKNEKKNKSQVDFTVLYDPQGNKLHSSVGIAAERRLKKASVGCGVKFDRVTDLEK